ncbi:MAG TPA: M56 family metallopeptidase [Vicinamibacterales bacterium]|nr:M56 family metallopeptidase [Vicinamibacterales bacterium]
MNALAEIAVHPVAQALTWALVHFIWQGAALGLLAFAILRFAPLSAQGRYVAGIITLMAMLSAPIATTAWLLDGGGIVAPPLAAADGGAQHAGLVVAASEAVLPSIDAIGASASVMPIGFAALVLPIWLGGVFLLSVRLLGGWVVARRLARRAIKPVSADIQVIVRRIAAHLALDRVVRVFESTAVSVPVMMGWLRPVVLLPTAALGGLSPMQLEALIAHELAHVRRHDYVVNLLQSAVETLLFYHPAVWWVSKQVRAEREHCCDDLAVEVCDRVVYVSALAELAAIAGSRGVALAATDGTLVTRVRRLLGKSREGEGIRAGWLPAFVVVFAVGAWMPAGFVRVDARDDQAVAVVTSPQIAVPVVAVSDAVPVLTHVEPGVAVSIQPQAPRAVPALAGVEGGIPVGVMEGVQSGVVLSPELVQELKQRLEQLRRARAEVELAQISKKLSIAVEQDEVRRLKEQLVAVEKIHADQAKLVELTKMSELVKVSVDQALKSKLAALEKAEVEKVQRGILETTTQSGTGNFSWSNDNERIEMKWTGAYRLSADDRDIEWVEPGKTVRISDGNWLTATGVEIKGLETGVERTFFKKSFKLAYEPEGREFLATMLQKMIRRSGLFGVERVKRLLAQGGVSAVLAEIDRLETDHARRVYYVALLDQATLSSRELADIVARAGRTITGDFELSATLARAATARAVDDAVRESIVNATKTIGGDFEQRRALLAATYAPLSERLALAGLSAARGLDGPFERSSYLVALAQAGGVTDATRQAYIDAANEIRAGFERDRALRAAGVEIESRIARLTPPRFELNRAQPTVAPRPLTVRPRVDRPTGTVDYLPGDLSSEVEAAKTSTDKADVLVAYVGSPRFTAAAAGRVFELTAELSSSADQRRVLEAAWAKGLTGMTTAAFLKTVASVRAESDRVALLLAVAKGALLSGAARSAYVGAADTIKSEADQTRVLAELVRNERRNR